MQGPKTAISSTRIKQHKLRIRISSDTSHPCHCSPALRQAALPFSSLSSNKGPVSESRSSPGFLQTSVLLCSGSKQLPEASTRKERRRRNSVLSVPVTASRERWRTEWTRELLMQYDRRKTKEPHNMQVQPQHECRNTLWDHNNQNQMRHLRIQYVCNIYCLFLPWKYIYIYISKYFFEEN